MGLSEPKYVGVPVNHQNSVPIVPVATAVTDDGASSGMGLSSFSSSSLPMASKIDTHSRNKESNTEDREDGITITWEQGEVQPSEFRDKWFAVAFIMHLLTLFGASIALGPAAWEKMMTLSDAEPSGYEDDIAEEDNQYGDSSSSSSSTTDEEAPPKEFYFVVVAISLIASIVLSFGALTLMGRNAIGLIKASLWFSVILCGLSAIALLATAPPAGIFYAIFTVCLIWYMRTVQNRIPYAASNLKCGITVLKSNLGLGLVALGSMLGLLVYCFGWTVALVGTFQQDVMFDSTTTSSYNSEDNSQGDQELSPLGGFVGFMFILCFYWTHQVFKNVSRATTSGVVGTWWFEPAHAGHFCSTAVTGSFVRSITYSLGSICFGSLIVAILQMLRDTLRRAQNDRNGGGILRCIAVCILAYIERLVEYFNKWAYVYVGLYGYGYVEAGKKVINLFKTRGWTTIIADNLVNRLLGIMSLTIGLLTGVFSLFAAFLVKEFDHEKGAVWLSIGFVVGFFIGLIFSGVFMGVLSSAVDAIIVCYAEAPKALEDSHPMVAQEMHATWSEAWGHLDGPVIIGLGGGLGVV